MSQTGYSGQERDSPCLSPQGLQSQAGIPGCVLGLSGLAVCARFISVPVRWEHLGQWHLLVLTQTSTRKLGDNQ